MAKKVPKKHNGFSVSKKPVIHVDPNSYLDKTPTWRFIKTDISHDKWSIKKCCDFNHDVLDKLVSFERQTWSEISIHSKKQNHHISVNELIKDARNRLEELKVYEDELFSLRLDGTTRLYGILQDGVFNIIWYDCNHEICPSKKKHT